MLSSVDMSRTFLTILLVFSLCLSFVISSTNGGAHFDYPYSLCGPQGSSPTQTFAQGETSYLCINFNGKTKAIFTVTVDQFAAISLSGCEFNYSNVCIADNLLLTTTFTHFFSTLFHS